MTVSIIWSSTNGGASITSPLDHGTVDNGSESIAQEIFLRHDGANNITDSALYVRQVSGTYSGAFTAATDLAEFLDWGDATTESAFGGFMANFNATTAYATGWPVYNSKSPSGGTIFRTGVGDSEENAITIPTTTGATAAGEIQAGSSPNVRFQTKIVIPSSEDTLGIRQLETVLRYTFTS